MLNDTNFVGNLTRDPELTYTQTGIALCRMSVAVQRDYKNNEGGYDADFIPVVVWRQLAEVCASNLTKGRKVAIKGRIQSNVYENQEGKRVSRLDVVAESVYFLDRKNDTGNTESSQGGSDPFHDDGKPIDISDDNLPF